MERFDFCVDVGTSGDNAFNGEELSFGGGYSTIVSQGLRSTRRTWNVQFEGSWDDLTSQGAQARAFILRHADRIAFLWRTPAGEELVVRAVGSLKEDSIGGALFRATATFKEFPEVV